MYILYIGSILKFFLFYTDLRINSTEFSQVCLLVKETAEIETGMAEKSSWDQANIRHVLPLNHFMGESVCQPVPKLQLSWVRFPHPPTQWNLRAAYGAVLK
jgi:hypothetical protein